MLRSAATAKANEQKETPIHADAKMDSKFIRCKAARSRCARRRPAKMLENPFRVRLFEA
jgi:hypothetical protein